MSLATLNITINANANVAIAEMGKVQVVANDAMGKAAASVDGLVSSMAAASRGADQSMKSMSQSMNVARDATADSMGKSAVSVDQLSESMAASAQAMERAATTIQQSMAATTAVAVKEVDATTRAMEAINDLDLTPLQKNLVIGFGAAFGAAAVATQTFLDGIKSAIETKLIITGIAMVAGISAVVVSGLYAAYKATNFVVGLFTGESYKSANIDALIALNKEIKNLQGPLNLTAVGASALNEALKKQGVDAGEYTATMLGAQKAVRANGDEMDRLGVKYKAQNGSLLSTEDSLKSALAVLGTYTAGWDRQQAEAALGMGSEKQIQAALSITSQKVQEAKDRLVEYGLVIGPGTQAAVAKYEESMRLFQRESDLTAEGFKRAIADNIMPLLTDLSDFFRDGFPFAVMAFRYSMAIVTSLFYGLKTSVYIVAESIVGSISAIGSGLGGLAVAAMKALKGDFSGANDALTQGWEDAKTRLAAIGDNIVAQARHNSDAMALAWGSDSLGANNASNAIAKTGKAWKAAATETSEAVAAIQSDFDKLMKSENEKLAVATAESLASAKLNDAEKVRAKMLADLRDGAIKMTDAERKIIQTRIDIRDTTLKATEAAAAMAKVFSDYAAEQQKTIDMAMQEAAANEATAATFGMTKAQIEQVTLVRLEDQLAQRSASGLTLDEIKNLEKLIDAKKRSVAALNDIDTLTIAKKAADDASAAWQKSADDINKSLSTALMNGFTGAKGFAKDFVASLKGLFAKLVLQPILAPISAGIASVLNPGAAQAASGVGGIASTASSIYSAGSGIFSAGASLAGASGAAIASGSTYATGFLSQQSLMLAAQETFGAASTTLATGASVMSSVSSALAAIPGYGWVALAAIAAYGVFGGGGETRSGGGYNVNASGKAVLGGGPSGGEIASVQVKSMIESTFAGINTTLKDIGSKSIVSAFTAGLESSKNNKGAVFAGGTIDGKQFGNNYDTTTYNRSLSQEEAIKELTNELQQAALLALQAAADVPKSIADKLAGINIDGLTTEATTALLATISTQITGVNAFRTSVLALPFENLKNLSFDAADGLITAAGGMDALGSKLGSYYNNFYTEAERTAMQTENVSKSLATLGYTGITTREQFRALMDGIVTTTAAGAAQYNGLLNLESAFAAVVPATESLTAATNATTNAAEIATKKRELEIELMTAQGNTIGALNAQRADEIAALNALSPALAAIRGQINALNAAATVRTTVKSIEDAAKTPADKLADATDEVKTAFEKMGIVIPSTLKEFAQIAAKAGAGATAEIDLAGIKDKFTAGLGGTLNSEVTKIFKGLSIAVPTTLAGFEDLQKAAKIGSGSSKDLFDALSTVWPAFQDVQSAADDAAKAASDAAKTTQDAVNTNSYSAPDTTSPLKSINDGYLAQIQTLERAGLSLAELRKLEIVGMDASTIVLYDRLAALKLEVAQNTQRTAMQITLYDLSHVAADRLAESRRRELAAMDATLRPLQQQIYAYQDVATAATTAMTVLTKSVNAQKTVAKSAYDAQIAIINAQKTSAATVFDKNKTVLETSISTATDANAAIKSLADSLKSTLDSMRLSATSATDRITAQAQISQALLTAQSTGVLPDSKSLADALSMVAKPDETLFASYADFARDYYITAGKIEDLNKLTGDQLGKSDTAISLAKDNLKALQTAYDLAVQGYTDAATAAQDAYDLQVSQLDQILTNAQLQIDAAQGTTVAVLSVADAVKALGVSLAALAGMMGTTKALDAAKATSPTSSIPVTSASGNQGLSIGVKDSAEVAAAKVLYQSATGGVDSTLYNQYVSGAAGEAAKAAFAGNPQNLRDIYGFASGGDHPGGFRLVGENGPEIEATGPSRIFNASQTRSMLSGSGNMERLEALVEKLTDEVILLKREAMKTSSNTKQTSDVLSDAQGGRPLAVMS